MERVTDDQFALIDGKLTHCPRGVDEYLELLEEDRRAQSNKTTSASKQGSAAQPQAQSGLSAAEVRELKKQARSIGIKVIAGLVQDKHVRRIKQNQHQLQTALLATGKRFDRHIQMSIGESQLLKQLSRGNFLAIYHVTSVVSGKNLANAIALQLFQFFELLGKESEFHGLSNFHATCLREELALNDIEQRRFASAVCS